MFESVAEAAREWEEAKQSAKDKRERLVDEVRAARRGGASLGQLSTVLGVSRERVRQMTGDPDDRFFNSQVIDVMCPRCGAASGEECVNADGKRRGSFSFHLERSDRRRAVVDGDIGDLGSDEVQALTDSVGKEPLEVRQNRAALSAIKARAGHDGNVQWA